MSIIKEKVRAVHPRFLSSNRVTRKGDKFSELREIGEIMNKDINRFG